MIKNFIYKGHSIELNCDSARAHQWSILIDGRWSQNCINFSDDGTDRSVVIEAKRLIDSETFTVSHGARVFDSASERG
jgi:hypothetical protein